MDQDTLLLLAANEDFKNEKYNESILKYKEVIKKFPEFKNIVDINIKIAKKKIKSENNELDKEYEVREGGGYEGYIDCVDCSGIHGWVYRKDNLDEIVTLDFWINGKKRAEVTANLIRKDIKEAGHAVEKCGFSFSLSHQVKFDDFFVVKIFVSGTNIQLFGNDIVVEPLAAKVSALAMLAQEIKRRSIYTRDNRLAWISKQIIPKVISEIRSKECQYGVMSDGSILNDLLCENEGKSIDVIIPVYDGFEETVNCIKSVVGSKNKYSYNVIIVNDCTPNVDIGKYLKDNEYKLGYKLVENECNLGFVGTVNRGMCESDVNDVILLNSDTIVPDFWVDQILDAAYSDPIIGTVTPYSNNATICSYPHFCQDNEIPLGYDVNSLNKIFQIENGNKVADLPTAHGFCMFIKRETLKEVGPFDERKWGKGYAEENDFSLRAAQLGWRNVIALGTFVQHLGAVSFAGNSEEFVRKNLEKLNGIYPDYSGMVMQFVKDDPLRPYRNKVALHQLFDELKSLEKIHRYAKKTFLFVSLSIGGGTQVATDDLAIRLREENVNVLMLTSPKENLWRVSSMHSNVFLEYHWPVEKNIFLSHLELLGVCHIHYHHCIEFKKDVWCLPELLDVEYDVSVHDYYTVCPRVNFIGSESRYCGEPSVDICNECIKVNGVHASSLLKFVDFNNDILDWRRFFNDKLENARNVIFPSLDTADRVKKYFANINVAVRPHPEDIVKVNPIVRNDKSVINVAFIGAIGVHKGYEYLVGCAEYALNNNIPLFFHVIGYTVDDSRFASMSNVRVYGEYDKRDLYKLVLDSQCTVAALLSVWPETYSYTLSESLRLGLKVVAFDIGAFKERIPGSWGSLLPITASYKDVVAKIISVNEMENDKILVGNKYSNVLSDYYGLVAGKGE